MTLDMTLDGLKCKIRLKKRSHIFQSIDLSSSEVICYSSGGCFLLAFFPSCESENSWGVGVMVTVTVFMSWV